MPHRCEKEISLSMPDTMLSEIDFLAKLENNSRNDLIVQIVRSYLKEKRRLEMKSMMRAGYLEMAELNLKIANESLFTDEIALSAYENFIGE